MLYHIRVKDNENLSTRDIKALIIFLLEQDSIRPVKSLEILWMKYLNEEAIRGDFLSDSSRIILRSSMPTDIPTILVNSRFVFKLMDSDLRVGDLHFDFPNDSWFEFSDVLKINGLTDHDWTILRLTDTQGIIV